MEVRALARPRLPAADAWKPRHLGAAATHEHQEATGQYGNDAGNVRDGDAVFLLGGRLQRPDVQDLLLGRVGEAAQHKARDAKHDQHDTDNRNRFHFPTGKLPRYRATPRRDKGSATSEIGIDLYHISVRIAHEQRAMAPRLIGWFADDFD